MPSEDSAQRLHPISLLFGVGASARRLLLPGLFMLVASGGSNAEIWLMLIFIPSAVTAVVRYMSFRYRLGEDEMLIREGIVTRNERHIPYTRIQNINLVQNPLHRAFGVAEVHMETAGGEKPEAVIRVLSLQSVELLREHVFRGRAAATPAVGEEPEHGRTLLRLPPGELLRFGLISNRGMAVVAAAFGAIWQFDLIDMERFVEEASTYRELLPGPLAAPGLPATIGLALAGLLAALILLRLFSMLWALAKFYGFTLVRRGDDLRAEYGLLTRITATIPRHRIQLVSTRSTFLHRVARRAAVQAETAGGGAGDAESVSHRLWLAPVIREDQVSSLLGDALPGVDASEVEWRPLAPGARRRVRNRSLVVAALVTAATVLVARASGPGAAFGLLALPPAATLALLNARLYVRHTGWALTANAVLYRNGWWERRMSVVRFNKVQAVGIEATPLDRRAGMATLDVDTAGAGRAGHRVRIRYLDLATARETMELLFDQAARTRFRW